MTPSIEIVARNGDLVSMRGTVNVGYGVNIYTSWLGNCWGWGSGRGGLSEARVFEG